MFVHADIGAHAKEGRTFFKKVNWSMIDYQIQMCIIET